MSHSKIQRSARNNSLDDFLDGTHITDRHTQIIPVAKNTFDLPSKCQRCGAKTKQAGKMILSTLRDLDLVN